MSKGYKEYYIYSNGDNPDCAAIQWNANERLIRSVLSDWIKETMANISLEISTFNINGDIRLDIKLFNKGETDAQGWKAIMHVMPYDYLVMDYLVAGYDMWNGLHMVLKDNFEDNYHEYIKKPQKAQKSTTEPIEDVPQSTIILRDVTDCMFVRKVDALDCIEIQLPCIITPCNHLKPSDIDLEGYQWFMIIGDKDKAVYCMPNGQYYRCTQYRESVKQ